jgi:tetratricopeptide (TPR) repeat protein
MEEVARYYLGRAHLYDQQYEQALRHFGRLEELTDRDIENPRYRILGFLYQGMTYDAMGERDQATQLYRRVLDMEDPIGVHERAERYLQDPYSG